MARGFWRAFDGTVHALIAAMVLALAAIGCLQVFFRYVIESSLAWTEELSRILLIWLVLLAAGAEVKRGAHIAMRLLVDLFPPAWRTWVDRASLLMILGFAGIMVVYGLQLAERTMAQSATTLPLSMGQVYLALPIGGALIAINVLRLLAAGRIRQPDPAEADVV